MEMYHCEERIYVLPENAVCKADEYKRNPLDIDNCPLGHEVCTGDCYQYEEGMEAYKEIGTVEECRKAKRFKEYFDELYGIGLEVANWHQNGNTEPFDNFYDAAIDWSEQNER